MGRPANTIKSIEKCVSIPQPLAVKVDLVLYSELEGRVPHGAWARYITALIAEDLQRRGAK